MTQRENSMKRIILAAVLLTAAACGKKEQPAPAAPAEAQAAQPAPAKNAPGKAAPAYRRTDAYFRLPSASGGEIDLASYAGRPVLLMFFTETCPFCRKAAPFIERMHKKYAAKGLAVVGICLEESKEAPLAFAKSLGVTFPLAYDGRELSREYRTQGVPYIYMLDRSHEKYDVWEGYDPSYDASIDSTAERLIARKK